MKKVSIFFDYESTWGMPIKQPYDLGKTTQDILEVLARHRAKAAFNTTGKIVEQQPELVKMVARAGHEIAIHGYDHTNPAKMSTSDTRRFSTDLKRVEDKLIALIGKRPIGFRSPHLGAPRFYDPTTYAIFEDHGYAWASNREIRFIDEATSPRIRSRQDIIGLAGRLIHASRITKIPIIRALTLGLLNTDVVRHDQITPDFNFAKNISWLLNSNAPFARKNLTEIPVLSPLDCDFLGDQINPSKPTPQDQIEHMITSLCREFDDSHEYFNLNFHDWIIGTSNRLEVLDRTLAYIQASNRAEWILPRELILPVEPRSAHASE
jgi:hypothetical protein